VPGDAELWPSLATDVAKVRHVRIAWERSLELRCGIVSYFGRRLRAGWAGGEHHHGPGLFTALC
jgi:hypothetical protein